MRGAIFDMDGLLIDSERLFQETWREMAAEYGVTLDDAFSAAVCGNSRKGTEDAVARWLPMTDPAAFVAEGGRRVREKEERGVALMPGAVTILEGMKRRGFRLAVASSSAMDMIRKNLGSTGIVDYFDALVPGTEVRRGKPWPDIFLLAAERLGLPPADCYVFEDSINGIRAGHAAGCRAIMIPDLIRPTEEIRPLCAGIYPDLAAAWREIEVDTASAT